MRHLDLLGDAGLRRLRHHRDCRWSVSALNCCPDARLCPDRRHNRGHRTVARCRLRLRCTAAGLIASSHAQATPQNRMSGCRKGASGRRGALKSVRMCLFIARHERPKPPVASLSCNSVWTTLAPARRRKMCGDRSAVAFTTVGAYIYRDGRRPAARMAEHVEHY